MTGQCGKKHFGNIRFPRMVVLTGTRSKTVSRRFYKFSLRTQEVFTCTSRTTTFTYSVVISVPASLVVHTSRPKF
jgi:carbohydrate-selective porin OprB